MPVKIQRLHAGEVSPSMAAAAAQSLAMAFAQDPLYIHFVPDPQKRSKFLPRFMKFRLAFGLAQGVVLATDDLQGIAVWLPPQASLTFGQMVRLGGLSAMIGAGKKTMQTIMEFTSYNSQLVAQHLPGQHWTLAPIGVAPTQQGKGYGRALLSHGLQLVDAEEGSCILETQTQTNQAIYEKFGFATAHTAHLGSEQLPHILMHRPPATP